ncbi:carboxy terminal-processing peptidase [bacterium]|nr:carboxy terminal-processing peptidase [bacterium]
MSKSNRFIAPLAWAILSLLVSSDRLRAEAAAPTDSETKAAQVVSRLMEKFQISRHEVDDEISKRMFKAYLNVFDPLKIYFRTPDIEELRTQATKLDDDLKNAARLGFAFDVYKKYLARLDECAAWADEFTEMPHDFSKEEIINVDPDTAKYAETVEEARERWRVRVKFELENLVVDGKTLDEAKQRVHKRYKNLKNRWHELSSTEVVEMYLSTLTNAFDPHSTYMSPDTLEDFEIHMRLSLEGIGAMLQSEDGTTIVKELVPGGAADKDGRIKRGDQIVGVGEGENGEMEDIVEMKLRDVVKKIRGKAGTVVRLEVIPDGVTERKIYNLARQRVELADSAAKGEVIEYTDPATGAVRKIGVVNLPSFYADQGDGELFANVQPPGNLRTATNDVRRILEDFKAKGVDGVVVDLRVNGGGLLTEAISLTGLFIPDGPVVQVRDSNNKIFPYADTDESISYAGPLVVLVSRFSASASEIFAGAIKDYGRGIVVGDRTTHGKGTVQKVLDLSRQVPNRAGKYGALKLTMQQFYRVNGQSTQNRGVPTDIVLPSQSDNEDFGEASLDYALDFDEIQAARFAPVHSIDEAMVAQLRELSSDRITKDPALVALHDKKVRFDERKGRKSLNFTESTLRKEREEIKSEKKAGEEDADDEQTIVGSKKNEKFGSEPYSKEVLQIMSDFIRLKAGNVAEGAAK